MRIVIIGLIILLGKFSGFFKDVLITFYHGVSVVTDAYFLAQSISSALYMALYAVVPIIVVPLYTRIVKAPTERSPISMPAALCFFVLASSALGITVAVAAPNILRWFATGGLASAVSANAAHYLMIMAFTFALSTFVSFCNSVQTVERVTTPSYIVPIVNNAVFCIGLALFPRADQFDWVLWLGVAAWLTLAATNGWQTRIFLSALPSVKESGLNRGFLALLLPAMAALYIEQLNSFVAVLFATKLEQGAISVYGYSNKLNMVFLSVFLVYLTASLFPRIAKATHNEDLVELQAYLDRLIRIVVIIGLPLLIYASIFAAEIVVVVFQRGNFSANDAARVSSVFGILIFALPFAIVRDVVNRVFFSIGDNLTPMGVSLIALTINFLICYLTYRDWGLLGVALATVCSAAINCLISMRLIQRQRRLDLFRPSFRLIALCAVATLAAVLPVLLLHNRAPWLVLSIPFGMIYLGALDFLGVPEVRGLRTKLLVALRLA